MTKRTNENAKKCWRFCIRYLLWTFFCVMCFILYHQFEREFRGYVYYFFISQSTILNSTTQPNKLLSTNQINLLLNKEILTRLGRFKYADILSTFYVPLGYTIRNTTGCDAHVGPFLPMNQPEGTCEQILSDWIQTNQYLMKGHADYLQWYFDEANNADRKHGIKWGQQMVADILNKKNQQLWALFPYGKECAALYTAMKSFPPKGVGVVVGSLTPWVEAGALELGARAVVTAEYQPIWTDHPRLSALHPLQVARNASFLSSFDFAASFSSIEHSGLGRYGDILDPWGDVKEVAKVRCLLKDGGIFYLGLPTGMDVLFWNAHRQYGMMRWALITAGWDVLGIFQSDLPTPIDIDTIADDSFLQGHIVVVLRKPSLP